MLAVLAVAQVALLTLDPAHARAGRDALDPTFAGGRVVTDLGHGDDAAYALALLDDGRVVAAGRARGAADDDVALLRFQADGTPDARFGAGGRALVDLGASDGARALVGAGDGAMLLAGSSGRASSDFALVRVGEAGALDETFGVRGGVHTDLGGDDQADALALEPDGRILVAGSSTRDGRTSVALARYQAGGGLDPSFGDGGRVVTPFAGGAARALAVAPGRGGGIVVAGVAGAAGFVARYRADGALDPGFGVGGRVLLRLPDVAAISAVRIEPDGGILLAGSAAGDDGSIVLARFRADGEPDPGFGANGMLRAAVGDRAAHAHALARDPAGNVVVAGIASDRAGDDLLLLRATPDGMLDAGFGRAGILVADLGSDGDAAHAVAVQRDGRILVAGAFGGTANRDLLLARFTSASTRCGDAMVDPGESCDDGERNGAAGSCCSATCAPRPAGAVCRLRGGVCDTAETCDGTSALCPEDARVRAGALCRAAAGACDVSEVCDGSEAECPRDDVRSPGTLCRVATGACDLDEQCDGKTAECPADRRSTGECRSARGSCDPAEWCDGASNDCPADVLLPDGSACDDGDACTVDDVCVDASCRAGARDPFACSGYLCSTIRRRSRLSGAAPSAGDLSRELGQQVERTDARSAVCVPAFTGDDPPRDPLDSSADAPVADDRPAYTTYGVKRSPAVRGRRRPATLEDQFGVLEIDLLPVRQASFPARVGDDVSVLGAPPSGAKYQCYGLVARRGPARRELAVRVGTDDAARRYQLHKPRWLCRPVAAAGEEASSAARPDDLLLCYDVQARRTEDERPPVSVPLLATNAFESWLVEEIGPQHLCVPALLTSVAADDAEATAPTPRKRQFERKPRRPKRERAPDQPPAKKKQPRRPVAAE